MPIRLGKKTSRGGSSGVSPDEPPLEELLKDNNATTLDASGKKLGVDGALILASKIFANGTLTKLNMSANNLLHRIAGKALANALAANTVLLELDLSGNYDNSYGANKDGPGFAEEFAIGLGANGALASVNILNNNIGAEQAQKLVAILNEHPTLKSLCGNKGDETELDMSGKKMGADGAMMLAPEIVANGALTSLNISDNSIGELVPVKGWKSKDNDGMAPWIGPDGQEKTEDPSKEPAGAIALAEAIRNNGALVKLTMGDNKLNGAEAGKALSNAISANTVLKELDLSSPITEYRRITSDAEFAKAFRDGLLTNRALAFVNILSNDIGAVQANELIKIMESKDNLKTLCDLSGDETELDLSKKGLTTGCAVLVAHEVQNNRTLVKFDISGNVLNAEGCKAIAEALNNNNTLTDLNIAKTQMTWNNVSWNETSAVSAICDAIPTMEALTSLNIKDNKIKRDGKIDLGNALLRSTVKFMVCDEWSITPETESLDVSEKDLTEADAALLAGVICTNGPLTSLNISKNEMNTDKAGKALGHMLMSNSVLKELNVSDNFYFSSGQAFAEGIAYGLSTNKALVKFDISGNALNAEGCKAIAEALKNNNTLTDLNIANNNMTYSTIKKALNDMSAVCAICDAIPTMKALVQFDISSNNIVSNFYIKAPREGIIVGDIINGNPVTKEKDTYGYIETLQLDGIKALANGITEHVALKILNVSNNNIPANNEIFTTCNTKGIQCTS